MKKAFLFTNILFVLVLLLSTDLFAQRKIKAPSYTVSTTPTATNLITMIDPTTREMKEITITNFLLNITIPSAVQSALDLKANLTSPTFATSVTGSFLTASEMLITNGSKQIISAPVATYPSLTELSYVKGLSSAVQTQLDLKATAATSVSKVYYGAGGPIQFDSLGTNTTPTAGTRYWTEIFIPAPVTLSGLSYLVGSVGGTDSVYCELYNSAGTLVKRTDVAIVGTAQQIQNCAFGSVYAATAGLYFIAVQFNGNTARFMTHNVVGSKFVASSAAGTFGLAATFTPGSSYAVDKAPFVCTW